MLAALALQSSLLVAPMAMGDAPPETRAVAAVTFLDKRLPVDEIRAWWSKAQSGGREFEAYARACATKPTETRRGLFGTYARSMIAQIPGDDVFAVDVGGTSAEPIVATDGGSTNVVTQRIERDAAVRQILVAGTDAAARTKIDAIARELKDGANFVQLARAKSDDRASALRGGDLAIYERSANDALLREAAFNTKVGELSDVIASPLGFHILQRVPVEQLDPRLRDDTWAHARMILVQFNGAVGADPALKREHDDAEKIANELAERIRRGEEMSKVASEFNDDRGGRERAGDVGWVRRATTRMPPFFDRLFVETPGTLIGPLPSTAGYVLLRREDPSPRSRIDLRKNAFVDLEQWVRKLAEAKDAPPAIDGLAAAVDAARALNASFGSSLEWGRIEGDLVVSPSAADFAGHCAELPENITSSGGRPVALRELASNYAKALVALEPQFLAQTWPAHERVVDLAFAALKEKLAPLGDNALDELLRGLGMSDPRVVVPVYLVAEGPWPGGVTHRATHGSITLIDADQNAGTLLLETVLHESCHALDIASEKPESALDELRRRMTEAGIDSRDRLARDVPHTLMFVTAAWVVRHVFDAAHKDYGDAAGYYAKVPEATAAVRAPWTDFLDGKKSRDQALQAIVDAVKAKK